MDGDRRAGRRTIRSLSPVSGSVSAPVDGPGREPFSMHLRRLADPVWQAQHAHPFVRGIGDGSLDLERFQHWVRQDYRFLVEYCRLFGLAAARAPDLDTLARFADLLQATARTEMDLHRAYAADLGIAPAALEREPMAPTTRAYTDFLVRVAATGDFAELAATPLDPDRPRFPEHRGHGYRATRHRMEDAFLTSSRYEYLFWDMAWLLETWPV